MKAVSIIFLIIVSSFTGFSQERNWKIQKTKDGLVTVKSEIVDGLDENDEEIKIMYYVAERVGKLTLKQAEAFLRNSSNYIAIWESTQETREIRKISENEWGSYFLYSSTWPMPKSDCIQHYSFAKVNDTKFRISARAIQDESVKSEVKRLSIFDVLFEFEELNEEELKLTLSVKASPAINAPMEFEHVKSEVFLNAITQDTYKRKR